MIYRDFYTELGKLLFAIAKADGKVGAKEFESLKAIVKEELVPLENSIDQFGTDNAFYTEMEFDFLEQNFGDHQLAFDSFIDFVETHKLAIKPQVKDLIRTISARIASSEYGINKKEKALLDKLNLKMATV